jgi:cold shock CspA family protein
METDLQLETQGFEPSIQVRELIAANIEKLEARFGRITSCWVTIRAPGAHHRMGEPYTVSIRMALPKGREVNVGYNSKGNSRRQVDVTFAIHDAFRRATRQLRDNSQRLQGNVKPHAQSPIGKITRVEAENNCGFLRTADGREVYFHANSVLSGGFRKLKPDDRVVYHEEGGDKGPQASTVRVLRARHR